MYLKHKPLVLIASFMLLVGLLFAMVPLQKAIADPGSPIEMVATNNVIADGVAPLPTIDASTLNGKVANVDLVTHNFDFTVNTNDGNPHNLSYVIIDATLDPAAGKAVFSEVSIPTLCIGQYPGGQKS